jgi:SAM-dependent methyltransferase
VKEGPRSWTPALPPNAWLRWDVVSRLLPDDAVDVLEIGCGQGGFAVRLARRYNYLGIDPDIASFQLARSRLAAGGGRGEVRNGDLSVLNADEAFDLVCAFEVIEHIADDSHVLSDWAARVRPGGWLMLSTPAWQKRFAAWDELAGHFRRYDPGVLQARLSEIGLTDVRIVPFGGPLGIVLESVRNGIARRRGPAAAGESKEARTAASGRLLRLPDGPAAFIPYALTLPFMGLQRALPGRGTGLVALARNPAPRPSPAALR